MEKTKRIIRPKEARARLGVGNSMFYEKFVGTGRLKLVKLGTRAKGVVEDELDSLINEMIAERDQVGEP